jgi:hypothetical protein
MHAKITIVFDHARGFSTASHSILGAIVTVVNVEVNVLET